MLNIYIHVHIYIYMCVSTLSVCVVDNVFLCKYCWHGYWALRSHTQIVGRKATFRPWEKMLIPWGCSWKVSISVIYTPGTVGRSKILQESIYPEYPLFFTGFYDVLYASAAGFLPSTVSHAAMLGPLPKAVFFLYKSRCPNGVYIYIYDICLLYVRWCFFSKGEGK